MSDADTHADTESTSKYETPVRQKRARRIIAGMIYSPSYESDGFRHHVADDIADQYITAVTVHNNPATNADVKVLATITLPQNRSLTDNRCLDLFNYTHNQFRKFTRTDNGTPRIEFDGTTDGYTVNFAVEIRTP